MFRLSFWFALSVLCLSAQAFAATVAVTSSGDTVVPGDGGVTLREAISAINAGTAMGDPDITNQNPGVFGTHDTIGFDLAGAGVHTIALASSLPAITRTVFIDGYSQPGASPNTNALDAGINAVLQVEIIGVPGGIVLDILAPGTRISGLAISGGSNLVNASDVVIAGNFFGTDASGMTASGLAGDGYCIQVASFGSTIVGNVTIGGPAPADRNLIVSAGIGVQLPFLPPGPGTGYVIQGNYIGTDITGTRALARGDGLDAISNALVAGNLISGNPFGGVQLIDNDTVQGNLIGTQRDGAGALPNGNFGGIEIHGGHSIIGGDGAGEPNVIAHHAGYGIVIYNGSTQGSSNVNTGNRITRNSIYANQRLGISLDYSDIPLLNDAGDADSWAVDHVGNDGQNYPVLTSAAVWAGNAVVSGTLNSVADNVFTLEFFANAVCSARGHGEGQTFIGSSSVTTDSVGNASFGALAFAVPPDQPVITATATDAAGNTSEFSPCLSASGGAGPTTTALVSSPNPSTPGQSVVFTATVGVTGSVAPTGSVQFKDGAANLGAPVALDGAVATLTTSALAIGTHPITATYSGDASLLPSTSPVLDQLVQGGAPAATTTILVSSLNPSFAGQAVTFTATVDGASPTGAVQFNDGGTALVNAPLNEGMASFTTSVLALGAHPLTAVYAGDAANSASTSPVLTQIIAAPPGGGVSSPQPAPTLSQWMLMLLLGVLGAAGLFRLRRADP